MKTPIAALAISLIAAPAFGAGAPPLKEAKLIIEHNATDKDTGFQGFVDSEGWDQLTVTGPGGKVLHFEGLGSAGKLGLTELFFESVEPENKDVPIESLLKSWPEGEYQFEGRSMENGESGGATLGSAVLSHSIPDGPVLLAPVGKEAVATEDLTMRWGAVDKSITGEPVKIIAYQLIVEKDVEPDPRMIGKRGLSMYLPSAVTEMEIPESFIEAGTAYKWEVLAIAESGNQTLSSGEFKTK